LVFSKLLLTTAFARFEHFRARTFLLLSSGLPSSLNLSLLLCKVSFTIFLETSRSSTGLSFDSAVSFTFNFVALNLWFESAEFHNFKQKTMKFILLNLDSSQVFPTAFYIYFKSVLFYLLFQVLKYF